MMLIQISFKNKVFPVIGKVFPVENKRIERNSQEWFDSKISEKLIIRDKLFKKYKKTRFHVNKNITKEHNIVCKISLQKRNKNFFKTNSKCVSVNLKIYGKLLNHSDDLINSVDV